MSALLFVGHVLSPELDNLRVDYNEKETILASNVTKLCFKVYI